MIVFRSEGKTYSEIATIFKVSRQRIEQIVNKKIVARKCVKCSIELGVCESGRYCMTCQEFRAKYALDMLGGLDRIREEVRIRDDHICQECGKVWIEGRRRFDVHHLDPNMEGRSKERGQYKLDKENMDKMITLCHKCHLGLPHLRAKMSSIMRK